MAGELVVVKGDHRGTSVRVDERAVVIGRSSSVDLPLGGDSKASSKHAKVTPLGGERFLLEDLDSTNGTFVNSEPVASVPLRSGDLIKIGRSLIVFRNDGSVVQLEDIALIGGGSTQSIARREAGEEEEVANSSSANVPRSGGAQGAAALEELIVGAGEVDLARSLEMALSAVRADLGADRVLLFLRRPATGGLGCAAAACKDGVAVGGPVEPGLLGKAAQGEGTAAGGAAAVPVRILGMLAGAIYADGGVGDPGLSLLSSASVVLGLRVGLDRSRRLASSAAEVVALAQAAVSQRSFDLLSQVQAVMEPFIPGARARGLVLETDLPERLVVRGDPFAFSRGLDRLLQHAVGEARGSLRVVGRRAGRSVTLAVRYGAREAPDVLARQVDPQGVVADLRRAGETFGDGCLAVARVSLMRAGARFSGRPEAGEMVFSLELEAADGAPSWDPASTGGDL